MQDVLRIAQESALERVTRKRSFSKWQGGQYLTGEGRHASVVVMCVIFLDTPQPRYPKTQVQYLR